MDKLMDRIKTASVEELRQVLEQGCQESPIFLEIVYKLLCSSGDKGKGVDEGQAKGTITVKDEPSDDEPGIAANDGKVGPSKGITPSEIARLKVDIKLEAADGKRQADENLQSAPKRPSTAAPPSAEHKAGVRFEALFAEIWELNQKIDEENLKSTEVQQNIADLTTERDEKQATLGKLIQD